MLEVRGNSYLGEKTLRAENGAELGVQELKCYRPVMTQVLREINGRHSTGADLALDIVPLRQRLP